MSCHCWLLDGPPILVVVELAAVALPDTLSLADSVCTVTYPLTRTIWQSFDPLYHFVYLGRSYMERGGRARSLARSVVT